MRLALAILGLASSFALAEATAAQEPATGPALAGQLCNSIPEDTNTIHGKLIITASGQPARTVPVVCGITVHGDSWETYYDTSATADAGAERLVVVHTPNAPNKYLFARASSPSASLPATAPLSPEEAEATPLGGSDFSAADLGLDFAHWPEQLKLKGQMYLGQPCYVLDSREPSSKFITRIESYIDKESNAPIMAAAYDAAGHKVKQFSLHGSSFKRVHGHWRLENMDIRDYRKRSHTELQFDIGDK
ncbi:MAG TPA: outer membrane lipoprotein-sorting protein [Verrucomicrobiae bacterium]|jgi:hypothetical protein